ncbi:MAG: acetyl-CoA C-acyltransferase [bacterium]|nr:acetyl-CoA C-acyltransferase [bacterium]
MGGIVKQVVIVAAARTPIGSFNGALASVAAPRLGAVVVAEVLRRAGVQPELVDEVIMGNVLPAGTGQAPARQAALFAGLPEQVACTTVNKVCGSGLKAVMLAAQAIACGDAEVVVAGGMENMSQVPHYLPEARNGLRLGHGRVVDGMIHDGLWDVYNNFHMGNAAEICARDMAISRADQDAFAAESYRRSTAAIAAGAFQREIVPVPVPQRKGDPVLVDTDEEPGKGRPDKLASLNPAFDKAGTVTAGNASSINDGAAALLLMSADKARELGLKPMARVVAAAGVAQKPEWFTTAPAASINKALAKAGLRLDEIDLFEINEAFSVVSLANERLLKVDPAKVNPRGGAVSLGHPIGASGARVLVTLLHELEDLGKRRGLASLCIGGGEAVALIVEREV